VQQSDTEIIELVLNGDKDQFRVLIQRYKDKLYGLCLKMLKDEYLAEEVLQESFIEIFRNLSSYKFQSQFSTWAYTITYRKIAGHFRQGKKNQLLEELRNIADETVYEDESEMTVQIEQLNESLSELNATEKAVIHMFYFDGLKVDEIAKVMSFSSSKIKVLLFRTRNKLKVKLEKINAL